MANLISQEVKLIITFVYPQFSENNADWKFNQEINYENLKHFSS